MYQEEELLLEIIAENYAIENNFDEILTENFIDDIKKEYTELQKRDPKVAGMVKNLIYTTAGPVGGLVYGVRQKQLMKKGKIPKEHFIILRKTLKGLGYPLLAGIITPVGSAALSALLGDEYEEPKPKVKSKGTKKKEFSLKIKKVEENCNMYYTEEELLEAVDILVEDYGIDEDEAIEMIAEAYEMELYNESLKDLPTSAKNLKNDVQGYVKVSGKKYANQAHEDGYTDEDIQVTRDTMKQGLKKSGKQFAKDAAPVAGAAVVAGAGAMAARKAYKAHQAKKEAELRRRRSLRYRLTHRR